MKIKRDDIKKLKQLDRVELMLKENRLEESKPTCRIGINMFCNFLTWYIALILLIPAAFGLSNPATSMLLIRVVNVFSLAFQIVGVFIILEVATYFILKMKHNKAKKEMYEDYFKVELKIKGAKK